MDIKKIIVENKALKKELKELKHSIASDKDKILLDEALDANKKLAKMIDKLGPENLELQEENYGLRYMHDKQVELYKEEVAKNKKIKDAFDVILKENKEYEDANKRLQEKLKDIQEQLNQIMEGR